MDTVINLSAATLRLSTPMLLMAMAGLLSYQVGLINIALEGLALAGAFAGVVIGHEAGAAWLGVVGAMLVGAVLGGFFALAVITLRANLIVTGLAFNFLAAGGTAYLLQILYDQRGTYAPEGLDNLGTVRIPLLQDAGFLGDVFSGHSPMVYLSWLLVPLTSIFLYRTVIGGHIRAAGEYPEAARTAGISVRRMQYFALILGGAICGLAGAHMSLSYLALFRENMLNGRGFIALAAVYFGAARPRLAAVACLLFGFFEALQFRLQTRSTVPSEFFQMLPYLMVVLVLVVISVRKEWQKGW